MAEQPSNLPSRSPVFSDSSEEMAKDLSHAKVAALQLSLLRTQLLTRPRALLLYTESTNKTEIAASLKGDYLERDSRAGLRARCISALTTSAREISVTARRISTARIASLGETLALGRENRTRGDFWNLIPDFCQVPFLLSSFLIKGKLSLEMAGKTKRPPLRQCKVGFCVCLQCGKKAVLPV